MTNLVYVSYDELIESPKWLSALKEAETEDLTFLDPHFSITEQIQKSSVYEGLSGSAHYRAREHADILKLSGELFQPFDSVLQRIQLSETTPYLDVSFKNLYCLLRASVVIVDMNSPGVSYDVFYSWVLGIPILGITHRFLNYPSLQEKCDVIITPRNVENIIDHVYLLSKRNTEEKVSP